MLDAGGHVLTERRTEDAPLEQLPEHLPRLRYMALGVGIIYR